jgi:MFS family permease
MDEDKTKGWQNPFKLNKSIWFLTASDIFTWGLYLPLTALVGLYLSNVLDTEAIEIVGIGIALYYITRSLTQIPIGMLVDKIKRDRDDIVVLILGNILIGLPFLFFPLIEDQSTFFILQIVAGLGASMNLVTWRKLFAKNLDHNKEGTAYAVYDTILSVCIAGFSFVMGLIASINQSYFDFVMIATGILIISSAVWPVLLLYNKERKSVN